MRGLYIIPFINAFQQRLSTMPFSNAFQQRLSTTPFNNAFQQCLSTMPFNNIPTFIVERHLALAVQIDKRYTGAPSIT